MRSRPFGPAGVPVAEIGEGTWNMEGERAEAVLAIRRALDLGMTHVDTAEMYGDGAVEALVGEAIAGRRDEVFLASKVLPQNASRAGTIRACERSLARLGTDRLDLYLLHWPGDHPLEDTFAACEELRTAGKIASWGVSNFDEDLLTESVRIAGEGRIACNQVLYHLGERAIEHAVIPFCEAHSITVVAYSPFGSGDFPSAPSEGGRVLAGIARDHGATPRQIALAFLLRRDSVLAIPKATRIEHVEENAAASGLRLSAGEIDRLDSAFPRRRHRPGWLPSI